MIADDFTVKNGENEKIENFIRIENIKRKIYKDKKMGAALYIDDNRPGIVNGVINSQLKIEVDHPENLSKDGRIAHRVSEILEPEYLIEGITPPDFTERVDLNGTENKLNDENCTKIIEIIFITDSVFTERFNTSVELQTYLVDTLNEVENIFNSSGLRIEFVLLDIVTLTRGNETHEAPYITDSLTSEFPEGIDSYALYNTLNNYYCGYEISLFERADAVFLITGRRFLTRIENNYEPSVKLGHSLRGGICWDCGKYSVIQDTSRQTFQTYIIIAHELGHLLGAVHDGDEPMPQLPERLGEEDCSSYIMSSFYDYNAVNFSRCSVEDIMNYLNLTTTSCVSKKCQDHQIIIDRRASY